MAGNSSFAAVCRAFREKFIRTGIPRPSPYSIGEMVNRAPWNIACETRLAEFLTPPRGRKTVVYIADAPNASTFRYRVYNVRQGLATAEVRVCYFFRSELREIEPHLQRCDLLVFHRAKWTDRVQRIIDQAKALSIPLAYDVDDMICGLEAFPLVAKALNLDPEDDKARSFWLSRVAGGELVARQCDAYLATNRHLADWLSRTFGGKPSLVIENGLNREQLMVSERIIRQKRENPLPKDEFAIGYFSGTASHVRDFAILAPELTRFLRDHPSAHLVVVGFMEFPADMQPLIDAGRIVTKPLLDFLQLQAEMAAVDVNVVPLVENDFTNCKSELKYFESAVVNTLTLATPTYAYAHAIRHGETGFLCRKGEWYPTLVHLIKRECDIDGMVSRARQDCLVRYSGETYARRATETLKALMRR